MDLEVLYFLTQILAGLAVFGSLVFVGLQIRASTREQQLTRANEGADNYSRFQVILIENPEFRDIWIKGADDINQLDPSDLLAFGAYMALWVDSATRMVAQNKAGHASGYVENAGKRYRPLTRRKGTHQWWEKARLGYEEDTRAFIDKVLSTAKTEGSN
jgi:hypothetical protein